MLPWNRRRFRPLDGLVFAFPFYFASWPFILHAILLEEVGLSPIQEDRDSIWSDVKRDLQRAYNWLWIQLGVRYPYKPNFPPGSGDPTLSRKEWRAIDDVVTNASRQRLRSWVELNREKITESLEEPTCR